MKVLTNDVQEMALAHKTATRNHLLAEARQLLKRHNILLSGGHFDYGNGYHGTTYRNPHEFFLTPTVIWTFAQALIAIAPDEYKRASVSAGPLMGGALLAHTIAGLLDGDPETRQHNEKPKIFVPFHPDPNREYGDTGYYLKDFYRLRLEGQTVCLWDDVANTGQTLAACKDLAKSAGATVVGDGVILRRKGSLPIISHELDAIQVEMFDDSEPIRVEECRMCHEGVKLTTF